jgi:hypothetical protein
VARLVSPCNQTQKKAELTFLSQFAENHNWKVSLVLNKVNDLTAKTIAIIRRENVTGGAGDVEDEMRQERGAGGLSGRRATAPRALDVFAQTQQCEILKKL